LTAALDGVALPMAGCGSGWLSSCRQVARKALAWERDAKIVLFRHSSQSLPLKLSTKAFCCGLPGAM
tara:strand:+ start:14136 stop:14336 length:201 start_codon:yes stop_codon:yes gene_type:complete